MRGLAQRLGRRGFLFGAAALAASCTTTNKPALEVAAAPPPPQVELNPALTIPTPKPLLVLDPEGQIRKPLLQDALVAFNRYGNRITVKDEIYLVDFKKHSSLPRLFRLDMTTGEVTAYRTAHGKGSDPEHCGFASRFSNVPESNASSVGAYVTAGMSAGPKHGPNVLLEGLEVSNNQARERAIIVHAADYCEPEYLAAQGKLGRSYGCFSVCQADLDVLRPAMDSGRLLFVAA